MKVLIVESETDLGRLWQRHLERQGARVTLVGDQDSAIEVLRAEEINVIILDLVIAEGSPLAIADYASYRRPEARVIFVTNTTFFSDGSIFQHSANACAFLRSGTPPEDLAAMVEHFGQPRPGGDRPAGGET
ncbi:response regulator [Sediminimonas sp.]|uniref:response regulator transcription factor n=1 Tax=Sediminimonas sp. TaxID=2823379 RepID=UPI0025CFA32E|nr:response regulator [Sediminimonas sp.]